MTSFTVQTADFMRALSAVAPHADTDPDFPPLHRVRVDVGDENLMVMATNRYTAGLALASVIEHVDPELEVFDLGPLDIKKIQALFKPRKTSGDELDDLLKVTVRKDDVEVADVSGLFPGQSLTLVRYPREEQFPELPRLIGDVMRKARPTDPVRLTANSSMVNLFHAAGRVYGRPLVIETTGKGSALLISCGEDFVGLLMPMSEDQDRVATENAWRAAWHRRLNVLTATTL